jgi:hypothetical protein
VVLKIPGLHALMKLKPIALLCLTTVVFVESALLLTPGHNHSNDITFPFLVCCLLALLFCVLSNLANETIFKSITLGYVLAIIIKILIDFQFDPTSHNLFPFEIIISSVIGFVAALIGVALGMGFKLRKAFYQRK